MPPSRLRGVISAPARQDGTLISLVSNGGSTRILRQAAEEAEGAVSSKWTGRFLEPTGLERQYLRWAWDGMCNERQMVSTLFVVVELVSFVSRAALLGWPASSDTTALQLLPVALAFILPCASGSSTPGRPMASQMRWGGLVVACLTARLCVVVFGDYWDPCSNYEGVDDAAVAQESVSGFQAAACLTARLGAIQAWPLAVLSLIPQLTLYLSSGIFWLVPAVSVLVSLFAVLSITAAPANVSASTYSVVTFILTVIGSGLGASVANHHRILHSRAHFMQSRMLDNSLLKSRTAIGERDAATIEAARLRRSLSLESNWRAKAVAERSESQSLLRFVASELTPALSSVNGILESVSGNRSCPSWAAQPLCTAADKVGTMEQILHDLNDLEKLRNGKVVLETTELAIRDVCRSCVEEMRARPNAVAMALTVVPDVPEFVSLDKSRIRQLILTALSHAQRVTTSSGHDCVEVKVSRPPEIPWQFLVEVMDSGAGIGMERSVDAEDVLFDGPPPTTSAPSSALGLRVAKQLVLMMKGEIGIHNRTDGKPGSCLWFRLPTHHAAPEMKAGVSVSGDPVDVDPTVRTVSGDMRSSLPHSDSGVNLPIRLTGHTSKKGVDKGGDRAAWSNARISSELDPTNLTAQRPKGVGTSGRTTTIVPPTEGTLPGQVLRGVSGPGGSTEMYLSAVVHVDVVPRGNMMSSSLPLYGADSGAHSAVGASGEFAGMGSATSAGSGPASPQRAAITPGLEPAEERHGSSLSNASSQPVGQKATPPEPLALTPSHGGAPVEPRLMAQASAASPLSPS